jgi:hypothetical protein
VEAAAVDLAGSEEALRAGPPVAAAAPEPAGQ